MSNGTGTKEDPWVLKTPPGKSEYMMYKDEESDPPALVCVVRIDQAQLSAALPGRYPENVERVW